MLDGLFQLIRFRHEPERTRINRCNLVTQNPDLLMLALRFFNQRFGVAGIEVTDSRIEDLFLYRSMDVEFRLNLVEDCLTDRWNSRLLQRPKQSADDTVIFFK